MLARCLDHLIPQRRPNLTRHALRHVDNQRRHLDRLRDHLIVALQPLERLRNRKWIFHTERLGKPRARDNNKRQRDENDQPFHGFSTIAEILRP